ncbi:uncharacterized protein ACBR49_000115 [Aulostomus maculatus]
MSAELYSVSEPAGNDADPRGIAVGGTKPLHRFVKAQPKIIGIIVLVLGASLFLTSITVTGQSPVHQMSAIWVPGFLMGALFIVCGILYVLTEHNPSKKNVTVSLALSIISVLGVCWTTLLILPRIIDFHFYGHVSQQDDEEKRWESFIEAMGITTETVMVFYTLVGGVILVVMSAMAGSALRSTKSQVIILTSTPNEMPVE